MGTDFTRMRRRPMTFDPTIAGTTASTRDGVYVRDGVVIAIVHGYTGAPLPDGQEFVEAQGLAIGQTWPAPSKT